MKAKIILVVMTALLGCTTPQTPGTAVASDQPENNMEILREKLSADKKLLIAENMGLTESEGPAFWPVYNQYQQELAKLGDRKFKLIEHFAGTYESMSNETARELLDEYLDIEADLQRLRRNYLPKFRGALSDKKVTRYYQLENKIEAVVNFALAAKIPLLQ